MRLYKHIVMWRFKESHNGKSALENALWMKEHLEGLVGRVPELLSAEVGISPSLEQTAAEATPLSAPAATISLQAEKGTLAAAIAPSGEYHACLVSTFADPEALARYKVNPLHKEISAYCKDARESRVAFDWWSECEV